jgi:hypothetical protein
VSTGAYVASKPNQNTNGKIIELGMGYKARKTNTHKRS